MKNKITVVGLLCLFIWNVALGGVSSILICMHVDAELHLEVEECDGHPCEVSYTHEEDASDCAVNEDCTDIELSGAEIIPTRANEIESIVLPTFDVVGVVTERAVFDVFQVASLRLPLLRAPPSIHWLTDTYLSKTVLRV